VLKRKDRGKKVDILRLSGNVIGRKQISKKRGEKKMGPRQGSRVSENEGLNQLAEFVSPGPLKIDAGPNRIIPGSKGTSDIDRGKKFLHYEGAVNGIHGQGMKEGLVAGSVRDKRPLGGGRNYYLCTEKGARSKISQPDQKRLWNTSSLYKPRS